METAIATAIGPDRIAEFFGEQTTLKISLDAVAEEKRQGLVNNIVGVFQQFDSMAAVEAKQIIAPKPGFHALRHLKLTVAENLALDEAIPVIAMLKTKGRR